MATHSITSSAVRRGLGLRRGWRAVKIDRQIEFGRLLFLETGFGASCGSSDFNMITEISDAVGESGRGRQARSPRPVGDSRTGRDCHDAVRVGAMAETILGRPV